MNPDSPDASLSRNLCWSGFRHSFESIQMKNFSFKCWKTAKYKDHYSLEKQKRIARVFCC